MRQFLLPDEAGSGTTITLRGKEYHYLINVLRLKPGDQFQGIDRKGRKFLLKMQSVQAHSVELSVIPGLIQTAGECEITLLQCLPKAKKMDMIMRMATEMGVKRIVPLLSDHTVIKKAGGEQYGTKVKRWQKITREALQQSGTTVLPEVAKPLAFAELLAGWNFNGVCLFCHQVPVARLSLHELLAASPPALAVLIGPEGGLSERETATLADKGFVPVYLGASILRTETAAVFALAAIKIILAEKSTWSLA